MYEGDNITKQGEIKRLYTDMYRSKDALRIYRWIHYLLITIISGCVCYSLLPKYTQEEVPVTYKIDFKIDMNDTVNNINVEQVEYSNNFYDTKYSNMVTVCSNWVNNDSSLGADYNPNRSESAYCRWESKYCLNNDYYDYNEALESIPKWFKSDSAEEYISENKIPYTNFYYSNEKDDLYSVPYIEGTLYATSDEKVIREIEPTVDKKDLAIGTAVGGIGGSIVLMGLENIIPSIRNWKKKKKDIIKKSLERLQVLENIEDTMSTQNK